jgi:SAM-dependent methyltransferase
MALQMPVRFKRFYREFHAREFTLLDVGCGFDSPSTTKRYFTHCKYYGVDRDTGSISEANLRLMERFIRVDLDTESLSAVPDGFFDVVMLSHIIEHLHHGLRVLSDLVGKLKPGGVIYIEYPGLRSFAAPHARRSGCSHFCDDTTHVRAYAMHDIINVLLDHRLEIVKAGTRRDPTRLLLTPAAFALGILRGAPWGRQLWDFFGFSEYVYARRRALEPMPADHSSRGALERSAVCAGTLADAAAGRDAVG